MSWNKDTVTDVVIFEHLYELSDGTLNLLESNEELLNTTELMRTNKKISNKNMPPQNAKIKSNKIGKKPFIKNNNNNQK